MSSTILSVIYNSFTSYNNSEVVTIIISILQMKKQAG